ncbi:MAG: glutamate synthase [Candidatus Rokubacteria bacterium]|nr:glutamate synthase [Candidatus Rokubacteria bacterium]MBI2552951.1 glutamate synthase [Candidatus Rokubacteria bacterium]
MQTVDCEGKTTREINREIHRVIEAGEKEITLLNPRARHNLAVAILRPVRIIIEGSVGYYCAGMIGGPTVEIRGSAGWGLAECMMAGTVVVDGNAGNGAAASIRGGTVVIRGDAAARAGISMKGGCLIIEGNAGYMTGFMAQKGTIVILGDADEALADSMYEAEIFVAGRIAELGNDAVVHEPSPGDLAAVSATLSRFDLSVPRTLQKVVAGRKLWNFDKKDFELWKEAL